MKKAQWMMSASILTAVSVLLVVGCAKKKNEEYEPPAELVDALYSCEPGEADVDSSAAIGEGVTLCNGAQIKRGASIGDFALIGEDATIETGAIVSEYAVIGAGATVKSKATVGAGIEIPSNATVPEGSLAEDQDEADAL